MDLKERLTELAKIGRAPTPVVTAYLDTQWSDEHQRDRVRIFLKNELAQARRARPPRAADADLDWVEAQGEALLSQATMAEANGVALFACDAVGLREVVPSRAPFENTFAVADTPLLRPLARLAETAPSTLVAFVDAETARLVPLTAAGAGEELTLQADVPGHPHRGGWTQRLAKLSGGVAVIRVGAPSESEMKSKKEALDDAISATKAAVAEGIVPGGGLALLRAIEAVEREEGKCDGDERTGLQILRREGNLGFDAARKEYVDLVEAGIIDPTKVVRIALENAVSVASLLLLTEATLTEVPEKKEEPVGAPALEGM